jgi:hypothetical protein
MKQPLNKTLLIASSGRTMMTVLQGILNHLKAKFNISGGSGKKVPLY